MKIGVDARELQGRPTGTGRYLRSLLRRWPEAGDRLLLYFNGPTPFDPIVEAPGIVARPLGDRPCGGLPWQEVVLPAAAKADGLDVFFAPAYVCPLRLAVPRVTTLHDLSFFSLPQDFTLRDGARRRLLVGASVRASRRLIAVSPFTAREIAAWFPEAADRTAVVTEGPDDDLPPAPERDEARSALGVRGPLLLAVGSVLNRRRLPTLLQALATVRKRRPALVLDVVGENRTHPPLDLPAMVGDLGLRENVRLSGFVSEAGLAARYAAADAAVYLSEYEGFGLPVLEAMSRGLPVLTSRRPATGELFGGGALLAEPDDPVEIAAQLERLVADAALRERLVAEGRALAAGFSWADAARRTRGVLEAALS